MSLWRRAEPAPAVSPERKRALALMVARGAPVLVRDDDEFDFMVRLSMGKE